MPLPSRPVSGTTIDSAWGQAVHDYTFAPSGCRCSGTATTVTSSTPVTLGVDTAIEDPGGYVDTAGNRVIVPAAGDGFYAISVRVNTVTGATTTATRAYLLLNGTSISAIADDNQGGLNVQIALVTFATLSAGDIVTVQAAKIGSGTSPSISIVELTLVRLGAELGA